MRKSKPYYFYDKIKFTVPIQSRADSLGRYRVRMEEILESVKIIKQVLNKMPETGDVKGLPIKLLGPNANPDPVMVSRELPERGGAHLHDPGQTETYPHITQVARICQPFGHVEIMRGCQVR